MGPILLEPPTAYGAPLYKITPTVDTCNRSKDVINFYMDCLTRLRWAVGVTVSKLMGRVRNVVLIIVYLDLENPVGSGFWVGGYIAR
jgi:hypothetical protein